MTWIIFGIVLVSASFATFIMGAIAASKDMAKKVKNTLIQIGMQPKDVEAFLKKLLEND